MLFARSDAQMLKTVRHTLAYGNDNMHIIHFSSALTAALNNKHDDIWTAFHVSQ